jgi:starch-binding outer membrane protein, SusD/RagB family
LLRDAPTTALGPDIVYNGNTARWIAAANTLKARYYLHTAPRHGQAAYQNALAHAELGINEAPIDLNQAMHGQAPGDFRSWHGSTQEDANIWAQFLEARQDIVAHQTLIDTLRARNDPRLEAYHSTVFHEGTQQILGANQWASGAGPYSRFSATRSARNFRQPFITWMETQLIKAEANLMLGNEPAARANVNAVRERLGMPAVPAPITLRQIMTEKWIAQFQNIDAYSDWRRTCFPRLVPGGLTANVPAARIPGRYVYGQTERQQNPHFRELAPARQPADVWAFAVPRPGSAGQVTCPSSGDTM